MFENSLNIKSFPFNKLDIGLIKKDIYATDSYPIVYILYNTDTKFAYVGETTAAISRMSTHLGHPDKSKLKFVYIISGESFNKSATLDIESNLIQYMTAAGDFKLLNGNGGMSSHNYYQKSEYFKVFELIWSKLEFGNIKMKNLLELENSDIFKYSPYKSLSQDQYNSLLEILRSFSNKNIKSIFIEGSAGTGKTILAVYLIKLLTTLGHYEIHDLDIEDETLLAELNNFKQKYSKNLNIGFVVPMTSLRSTLKKVFKNVHGLKQNMVIGPTDVIKKKYDLLIVDESHRLTRRKSIMGYGAFDNVNKKLGLYHTEVIEGENVQSAEKNGTQLDWIVESSQLQLFFYDAEQSIKPADIREEDFKNLKNKKNSAQIKLVSQMRSQGDNDYLSFVHDLLNGNIDSNQSQYNNPKYELLLFDKLPDMLDRLQEKEDQHGLCRSMSGYSWSWVSKNNPNEPDAIIDGVKLFWNRVSMDWIHSTTKVTEIGCIHTVQGYDLNYAAVIFGTEITYDKLSGKIKVIKGNYKDAKGKQALDDEKELQEYIIKIYKTMMYRAIKGTYVYVCDKNLRDYFREHISSFESKKIPKSKLENKLRILSFTEVEPFVNAVPVFDFHAAAGNFSPNKIKAEIEKYNWIKIAENININQDYFACQVIGESMNKIIKNGSYCLFKRDSGGSRNGKIVLVEHYNIQDPDSETGFTIKEYSSKKQQTEDGWEHSEIVLKPKSTEEKYKNIILTKDDLEPVKIVGIYVCTLD